MQDLRVASFNIENLDHDHDGDDDEVRFADRLPVLQAQVKRINADVLCFQEVHGQGPEGERTLDALSEVLDIPEYADFHVAHTSLKDDEDQPRRYRNQVIVSRFEVLERRQVLNDLVEPMEYNFRTGTNAGETKSIRLERPVLYTKLDTPTRPLHVVNLHLKSRIPTNVEGEKDQDASWRWLSASGWAEGYFLSSFKRVSQALEVRLLVDEIFDAAVEDDPWIVVTGDFNADADQVPVEAILGRVENTSNPGLVGRSLIPASATVPPGSRFTLLHHGKGALFDHLLFSRGLAGHYQQTYIHNELVHDESLPFAFDTKYPESDHAPVVSDFKI